MIIVFCCSFSISFSQELLTLDSALNTALRNNFGISIARNELVMAQNNNSMGNAGFLPRIDLNASADKSINNVYVKTPSTTIDNPAANTELYTAGIALRWTLFDGRLMFANEKYYSILENIGEIQLKKSIENVIAKIITQYFDIVKQKGTLALLSEILEISEFRQQLSEVNFQTGMGSEYELLKSKVELNFDRLSFERQKTVLTNSKTIFNDLLSRDVNTNFDVTDSIKLGSILEYNDAKVKMFENNKDLLLLYKSKELSEVESQKILSHYYPIIDFKAGYNYYDLNTEASLISVNEYNGFNFGLQASMNLFDGLKDNIKTNNIDLQVLNQEIKIKEFSNYLDSYLNQIYKEYMNEMQYIDLETENYILAQKNMEIAKESISVGSISSLQFRETQNDLSKAYQMLINAKYLSKIKETEILLLSGQILK